MAQMFRSNVCRVTDFKLPCATLPASVENESETALLSWSSS